MAQSKPQLSNEERARIAQLADQLGGIVAPFKGASAETTEAREALDNQRKSEVNVRETIMVAVADFSQRQQLNDNDIGSVAAKVCKAHNDDATRKTFETFVGEIKIAMRPGVRAHVPAIVDLRNQCWDNEEERKRLDKDEATPLKDTFKRKYHMLKQLLGAIEDGWSIRDHADVEAFRQDVENKQRENTKNVARELAKMAARLRELYQTFPTDGLVEGALSIEDVTEDRLKAALTPKPTVKTVSMEPATTTVADTSELPEVEDDGEENLIAEGVYDPLADVLGEQDHVALAEAA